MAGNLRAARLRRGRPLRVRDDRSQRRAITRLLGVPEHRPAPRLRGEGRLPRTRRQAGARHADHADAVHVRTARWWHPHGDADDVPLARGAPTIARHGYGRRHEGRDVTDRRRSCGLIANRYPSLRSASIGAIRNARRVGTVHAASDTSSMTATPSTTAIATAAGIEAPEPVISRNS